MTIRTDWVQKTQGQPPKTTILTTPQAARYLGRHRIPALYRVHDKPNADKVEELRAAARLLGFELGGGEEPGPSDFNSA